MTQLDPLNLPKPKPRKVILFSSRKLEAALAEGRLSSRDKLSYLIVPAVATGLLGPAWMLSPRYGETPPAQLGLIQVVCGILGAVFVYKGIKRCYQTNRSIDGRSFFERYILLVLPPSVVTGIVFLGLMLAIPIVVFGPLKHHSQVQTWYPAAQYALGPLGVILLYWLTNRSFIRFGRRLSAKNKTTLDDTGDAPPPLPS